MIKLSWSHLPLLGNILQKRVEGKPEQSRSLFANSCYQGLLGKFEAQEYQEEFWGA